MPSDTPAHAAGSTLGGLSNLHQQNATEEEIRALEAELLATKAGYEAEHFLKPTGTWGPVFAACVLIVTVLVCL